jgi:hypothetical protein
VGLHRVDREVEHGGDLFQGLVEHVLEVSTLRCTDVRPEILVLNAGATPRMGRLDQLSWADFTATWETDVKAGLYWLQAALNLPLKPGSRVLVGSSGEIQWRC